MEVDLGGNVSVIGGDKNETDFEISADQLLTAGDESDINASQPTNESPFQLEQSIFLVSINGYISPVLIFITLITNTLICIVLLRRNMRSPTNALLVAIASSDMLTGVWPLPSFVYFYAMGNYRDWVPHDWCFFYVCTTEYLPTVFHTASIWLTVALAAQRYIYVCHALRARELCTIPNFIRVIICIFLMAFLSQVSRFLEYDFQPSQSASILDPSQVIVACQKTLVPFVQMNLQAYFNVYYWFRVIFIHLIPCTSLVLLNGLLLNAMKMAQVRREQLLMQNRRSESRRLAENNCTTMMLVTVVGVFLLVEFPLAIVFITHIVENTFELSLIDRRSGQIATWIINLFILLSYPINFFIYCGMSRQFRATFQSMFCGTDKKNADKDNTLYLSLVSDNCGGGGAGKTTTL